MNLSLILLFFTGTLVGFINVMAGGGSALSLPLLIFLGLDPVTANGTNRVAILLQNISASASFKRQKVTQFRPGIKMALCTVPGAVIGAWCAVRVSGVLFEKVLGVVMILVVLTLILPKPKLTASEDGPHRWQGLIYPAMFGIGFYGGFIQAGVGYLLMAALFHLGRINLVQVNMYKVLIVLIYTIPVLGIFIWNGNVDWGYGLVLASGNALGGWTAAHLAVKKGDKLVKAALGLAVMLLALKLLNII